jgi:hypothetical protein
MLLHNSGFRKLGEASTPPEDSAAPCSTDVRGEALETGETYASSKDSPALSLSKHRAPKRASRQSELHALGVLKLAHPIRLSNDRLPTIFSLLPE